METHNFHKLTWISGRVFILLFSRIYRYAFTFVQNGCVYAFESNIYFE